MYLEEYVMLNCDPSQLFHVRFANPFIRHAEFDQLGVGLLNFLNKSLENGLRDPHAKVLKVVDHF